jgi:hypothetical protein
MTNQQLSMKIITATILFGSLLAIAGAAIMQLITYLLSQNFMPSQIFSQNNLLLPLKPFFSKDKY